MRRISRVLAVPLVLAIAGFVLAHNGSGSRAAPPAALGARAAGVGFTARMPAGWSVVDTASTTLSALPRSLTLQGPGQRLVIAVVHPQLPGAIVSGLTRRPLPRAGAQLIALGGHDVLRYPNASLSGVAASAWIYTLPTTAGTMTGVCTAAPLISSRIAGCERVLATVDLTSGSVLSLNAGAGYALEINRILASLDQARRRDGPGLASRDLRTRARAAQRLALADGRAARAARGITGVAVGVANGMLVAALRREASAFAALARATSAGNASRYARAQRTLGQAERALRAAYGELRRDGYRIS